MPRHRHVCPACRRAFRNITDYPRVRVLSFERLPLPEAVDTMSDAAARKQLAKRRRSSVDDPALLRQDGINMKPIIEQACSTPIVQDYLRRLGEMVGETVKPRQLLPPPPADRVFRWAYPIAGTDLYLSLGDADEAPADETVAEIQIHCDGPNLGSAGGPTLQMLGAIARLGYQGLLVARRPSSQ
jgi:hypothetical protein